MNAARQVNPASAPTPQATHLPAPVPRSSIDRVLELTAVTALSASGLGLGAALLGKFAATQVWIASFVLAGLYAKLTAGRRSALGGQPRGWHLLLLLAVALFFRLPAYNWIFGGQDQGLYLNIGNDIARTGGIRVSDTVLERLEGTKEASPYLEDNHAHGFVPGVYLDRGDPASPTLCFQFYHLWPVWIALVSGVFGPGFAVYALTLLALVSICFFYRLALLLTGSASAALAAGGLLALNPLHAFFSKFPVSEVPTLAFSCLAFTFLAAYWSRAESERRWEWLVLSAGGLGAVFVTRISGFMYLPFVVAAGIATLLYDRDAGRRRALNRWALGVVLLYGLSVVYGLERSPVYAHDIYQASFGRFGQHWRLALSGVALALGGAWGLAARLARRQRVDSGLHRLAGLARVAVGPFVFVALGLGLCKCYLLGWTSHYASDPWLEGIWHFSRSGVTALKSYSITQLAVAVGPLFLLAYFALCGRRMADARLEWLRIFVGGFFVYAAALLWNVPYNPYYTRYLVSELVPFLLLFVVGACQAMPRRRGWLLAGLVVSLGYSGVASALQLGKRENRGLDRRLEQLLAHVDRNDLILLDTSIRLGAQQLKTPLLFTYGRAVATIDPGRLHDRAYLEALDARYDDLFYLSESAAAPSGSALEDSTRVAIWCFTWDHSLPRRLRARVESRLYLYRLRGREPR